MGRGGLVSNAVVNRGRYETTLSFPILFPGEQIQFSDLLDIEAFFFLGCPVLPPNRCAVGSSSPTGLSFNSYGLKWFSVLKPDLVHFWQPPCMRSQRHALAKTWGVNEIWPSWKSIKNLGALFSVLPCVRVYIPL